MEFVTTDVDNANETSSFNVNINNETTVTSVKSIKKKKKSKKILFLIVVGIVLLVSLGVMGYVFGNMYIKNGSKTNKNKMDVESPYIDPNNKDELNEKDKEIINNAVDKCDKMHCCREDDNELTDSSKCTSLNYLECLDNNNKCVWECNKPNSDGIKFKHILQGISRGNGIFNESINDTNLNTDSNGSGKIFEMDECGTVYELEYNINDLMNDNNETEHHSEGEIPIIDDNGRRLTVFLPDARIGITTWTFPYPANVIILFISNGLTMRCSGSLISRIHVLTAAHCLLDTNGNLFSSFQIYPGYGLNGNYQVFNYYQLLWFTGWTQGSGLNDDMGIITLYDSDATELEKYGYLGFGYNNFNSLTPFTCTGYPTDFVWTLTSQLAYFNELGSNIMCSNTFDLIGGQSGGPCYGYFNYVVYGVSSHRYPNVKNCITRINFAKYTAICNYIKTFSITSNRC